MAAADRSPDDDISQLVPPEWLQPSPEDVVALQPPPSRVTSVELALFGAGSIAALLAGSLHAIRAYNRVGHTHTSSSELFGAKRTFQALGIATTITGAAGAVLMYATCASLGVHSAREFAQEMKGMLAGVGPYCTGSVASLKTQFQAATAAVRMPSFDEAIINLQGLLFSGSQPGRSLPPEEHGCPSGAPGPGEGAARR